MKQNFLWILCSATVILVAASCKKKDDGSRQSGGYVVSMTVSGPAGPSKPGDGASLKKSGTVSGGQQTYNPQVFDPYPLLYVLSSLFFVSLFVRSIKFQKQASSHSRSGFSSRRW